MLAVVVALASADELSSVFMLVLKLVVLETACSTAAAASSFALSTRL